MQNEIDNDEKIKEQIYLSANDYQSAIDVQDACNLSGVLFSFNRIMNKICNVSNLQELGTEWKNTHPICTLYLDKMVDLNLKGNRNISNMNEYDRAYSICSMKSQMTQEQLESLDRKEKQHIGINHEKQI